MEDDIKENASYLQIIESSKDTSAEDKKMIQLLLEQLRVGSGKKNLKGKITSSNVNYVVAFSGNKF